MEDKEVRVTVEWNDSFDWKRFLEGLVELARELEEDDQAGGSS